MTDQEQTGSTVTEGRRREASRAGGGTRWTGRVQAALGDAERQLTHM